MCVFQCAFMFLCVCVRVCVRASVCALALISALIRAIFCASGHPSLFSPSCHLGVTECNSRQVGGGRRGSRRSEVKRPRSPRQGRGRHEPCRWEQGIPDGSARGARHLRMLLDHAPRVRALPGRYFVSPGESSSYFQGRVACYAAPPSRCTSAGSLQPLDPPPHAGFAV